MKAEFIGYIKDTNLRMLVSSDREMKIVLHSNSIPLDEKYKVVNLFSGDKNTTQELKIIISDE